MCFDLLRSGKYTLSRQSVELAEVHNVSQADNFEARDEAQQVRHIIARLPVQQQKIVTLRDVKGCSYEEIEQVTGLNATNVRVLLSRARKRYVRNLINGVTMKVEEIERLLAEFYEGNTNEQEEELLKEAFRTEEVPEHLQKDKKLFLSFFPGEVVDNVPAGLEDKLSRMIDEKAEEEQRFSTGTRPNVIGAG